MSLRLKPASTTSARIAENPSSLSGKYRHRWPGIAAFDYAGQLPGEVFGAEQVAVDQRQRLVGLADTGSRPALRLPVAIACHHRQTGQ